VSEGEDLGVVSVCVRERELVSCERISVCS